MSSGRSLGGQNITVGTKYIGMVYSSFRFYPTEGLRTMQIPSEKLIKLAKSKHNIP